MQDLALSEALNGPLIRLVLRADKVSIGEFARILENASSRRNRDMASAPRANHERVAA